MDTLPKKPRSLRVGPDREKHQGRNADRGTDKHHNHSRNSDSDGDRDRLKRKDRDRVRDRGRDRDHNHSRPRRHRHRSPSLPRSPSSKRSRPSNKNGDKGKGKGKERQHASDPEPGEIRYRSPQFGDDFIPLLGSEIDGSPGPRDKPRSERARQKEKASTREWDIGKRPRAFDDERGSGRKRKYDSDLDDSSDRAGRQRHQYEPHEVRKAPWVSLVDWSGCHNVAELLHREVEAFVNYMSPTPVEDEIRDLVIQLVSKAITSTFPDARILPFGSFETKLYLPSGDIDLVVDSASMARSNKVNVLYGLANTLKRAGVTSKVTVISKAKVPIVKFVTNHGRLNVDISINQANGVKAGKIVAGFLRDMHGCGFALRCLIVIAKAFLNQRGMNEVYTGGLGSYSIVCMAISFLQMHPKIRRGEIEPGKNLGVLVMEFFELYGCHFNYDEVGISIRHGGTYFSKRERGWYDSGKSTLLSIEDPTDYANDISRGSYGIRKVRQTLAGAYGIMKATAYMRAGILSSRREGRSYSLRAETNGADMSILSSILGVTQETMNDRRLLQEVYEKRLLHKLLQVAPQASIVTAEILMDAPGKGKMSAGSVQKEVNDDVRRRLESDDEGKPQARSTGEGNSDESGRYDIQERRLTRSGTNGTGRCDPQTMYTTDEDSEGDLSEDAAEDEAYDSAGSDDSVRKGRVLKRRSYWLSKGIRDSEDWETSVS